MLCTTTYQHHMTHTHSTYGGMWYGGMYIHLHTPTCCGMLSPPADGMSTPEVLSGCPDIPSRMHRCNEPLRSGWEMHTLSSTHSCGVYTSYCSRIYTYTQWYHLLTQGVCGSEHVVCHGTDLVISCWHEPLSTQVLHQLRMHTDSMYTRGVVYPTYHYVVGIHTYHQ